MPENEEQLAAHLFENAEYLQSRQFTVLHKIVLGLIPKHLGTELQYSTKEIDLKDSNGRTCVSWAAARGDVSALKTLLEYGANPNLADDGGSAPIHHVRDRECCEILLQYKASVGARNKWGHTPLHAVTRSKGSLALLQLLVESGADVNATDYSCETPLCNGNVAIEKHNQCARYLIDHGADVEAATDSQDTLLHLATMWDAHEIIRLLLKCGADYTRTNKYGQNILHLAARLADSETITIFSEHGIGEIDVTAADSEGKTALDYLAERDADTASAGFEAAFRDLVQQKQISQGWAVAELIGEMAAMDLTKGGSAVCLTPVTMDDDEDDDLLDGFETHVFYDALESVEPDALPMEISV